MQTIELLNELLRFKSITPNDDGALNYIAMFMDEFEAYNIEENGVKNLILTKRFGDGVHFCFGGHIDVVPPGDGWDGDAFNPRQSDGYIVWLHLCSWCTRYEIWPCSNANGF